MRNSYLESYYNIIPKIQQDKLLEVLKSRLDEAQATADDKTLKTDLEKLIAELEQPLGEPLIQLRLASKYSKISSNDYNNMMEETYVDLYSLFKQNNTINRVIKKHKLLNDAVLRDVRSAMRRLENDIRVYKVVKENKTGITDAVFNTFYKDDNQTGESVYRGWVDTQTDSLKLPTGMDHSALSINGLAQAEISLTHYGGGIRGTLESEEHRAEKAIDESLETFWGEVILTDEPVHQIYDGVLRFGIITEIKIELFRTELINHIKYKPFTNYPLTVLKIKYKENPNDAWIEIDVDEQTSVSDMEFNFTEIYAKELMVVVNQQNPSINTYKIPKRIINNAQMWQQIVDREYSISTETDEPIQATQDMIDYITGWQAYVDAVEKYDDKLKTIEEPDSQIETGSIAESIFDATTEELTKAEKQSVQENELRLDLYGKKKEREEELVEVRKYEYVYGAYNIDVRRLWYMESGEYISPRYISNGTVIEAQLDVDEVIPSGTTIEYQVAGQANVWKNILPSGDYISRERLDIDPITKEGILRFPASGDPTAVYRNDEALPSSDYTYDSSASSVVIGSGWYVATAAYTVSYMPLGTTDVIPSGVTVSFLDDPLIESKETYTNIDSRQHKTELEYYPYINYYVINDTLEAGKDSPNFTYDNGRWFNASSENLYGVDAGEYYDPIEATVDGHDAENRTDYYENIRPALTDYNVTTYPYFEYFQAGKNLYFNVPLDDREVKVTYHYLNDSIQFRAYLRSNVRSDVSTTPILKEYTIKLRTI